MEVRALTRNVRISPEKARHVSRLIQGKSAGEALALVSPGPIIKRFRAKARGSAGRIRKRTSHLEVILTDMN